MLNTTLTVTGSIKLFDEIQNSNINYQNVYVQCPKECQEASILLDFKPIVELIQNELIKISKIRKIELTNLINAYLEKNVNFNVKMKLGIAGYNDIEDYIRDNIISEVNLDAKTAAELARFDQICSKEHVFQYVITYLTEYAYLRNQSSGI